MFKLWCERGIKLLDKARIQSLVFMLAFPKTSIFAFVSAYRNMKLEHFNGDHRTRQNLISFCYHT